MENKDILRFFLERGVLLDKEVLNLLSDIGDVEAVKAVVEKIRISTNKKIITKTVFSENIDKISQILSDVPTGNQQLVKNLRVKLGLSIEISEGISLHSIEEAPKITVKPELQEYNNVRVVSMTPQASKQIEVSDFVKYFRGRFNEMRNLLQERTEITGPVSINKIAGNRQGFFIIGLVSDKRVTKNKNILLDLEDPTGTIRALVSQNNKELYKKAEEVALDSVIAIKCSGNNEIVFVSDLIFPDSFLPERKKSLVEEYALFTGDLHVGCNKFLEKNFLSFIDYLNGRVPDTPEVEKIKYLFIVGDLITGVGIYQGQEKELSLLDVEEQYERVAELLGKIRKDIKIIVSPGNHDALRIMEPQPMLDEKYAWPIYNLKNVILTGNPSQINIGAVKNFSGFDVLTYHGYSYHYYANTISRLVLEKAVHSPEKIMSYLLMNRHLAPTHSSTLYFPSEVDPFIIRKIPDIFVSAHTHKSAVSYYNNILTISSSCWESKTAFQEKMGNEPDFCKVPMFNLKTRAVKILDFEREKE